MPVNGQNDARPKPDLAGKAGKALSERGAYPRGPIPLTAGQKAAPKPEYHTGLNEPIKCGCKYAAFNSVKKLYRV